jgi:hypothetical protein
LAIRFWIPSWRKKKRLEDIDRGEDTKLEYKDYDPNKKDRDDDSTSI